jgi:hypothetical protein
MAQDSWLLCIHGFSRLIFGNATQRRVHQRRLRHWRWTDPTLFRLVGFRFYFWQPLMYSAYSFETVADVLFKLVVPSALFSTSSRLTRSVVRSVTCAKAIGRQDGAPIARAPAQGLDESFGLGHTCVECCWT